MDNLFGREGSVCGIPNVVEGVYRTLALASSEATHRGGGWTYSETRDREVAMTSL